MKVRIAPAALRDLKDIRDHISVDLGNPAAATRTVKNIVASYRRLSDFPLIGASLSTKVKFDTLFRYLVSGNYLIFYRVGDDYVDIYRIIYGKRDYIKILFDFEAKADDFLDDTWE
ncbi:MAG: type II toxin-antitoxin system RelE/ParE family toxin [Bacteroides sp.]|nr:type II toxin-antitoxin system RelE/ParE family toxin [Eubacterium sp.]MCM1417702.1 type II toxin-antitoxin system RelE/ParE family toxin [Roseburia sp.]MCM1461832.1 type II toxin-antitoxin system RelE/ParE family toxin [Bacteroides sp.]